MRTQVCNQLQYQLSITTLIQNHVFRLDVSVDDTSTVKEGQGLHNTSCVEPGAAFVQKTSDKVCMTAHRTRGMQTDLKRQTPVSTVTISFFFSPQILTYL